MSPHKCGHKSNRLVGWTYESDEEAISAAQENLENLDTERQQQSLQYQIDQYEIQKSILENLDSEKQKEAYKKALEEWGKTHGVDNINDSVVKVVRALVGGNGETVTLNLGEKIGEIITYIKERAEKAAGAEGVGKWFTDDKSQIASQYIQQSENGWKLKNPNQDKSDSGYRAWWEGANEALTEAEAAGVPSIKVGNKEIDIKEYQKFLNANRPPEEELTKYEVLGNIYDSDTSPKFQSWSANQAYHALYFGEPNTSDNMVFNVGRSSKQEWAKPYKKGDILLGEHGDFQYVIDKFDNGETWVAELKKESRFNEDQTLSYQTGGGNPLTALGAYVRAGYHNTPDISAIENVFPKKAFGSTSFEGGNALINELGTEALITPHGTLTSLPSKTGIVPADLTKNVWALGEVAPTLIAQLRSLTQGTPTGVAGNTTYEEGQYIDSLTMNVYPTKDYDMDKLLMEARAKMRLTRHNN